MISKPIPMNPELKALLAAAKPPSEAEMREQRISFVYGNLPEESTATKDDVRRRAGKMKLV